MRYKFLVLVLLAALAATPAIANEVADDATPVMSTTPAATTTAIADAEDPVVAETPVNTVRLEKVSQPGNNVEEAATAQARLPAMAITFVNSQPVIAMTTDEVSPLSVANTQAGLNLLPAGLDPTEVNPLGVFSTQASARTERTG